MSNNLGFRGGKNWAQASAGVQETEFAGGGGGLTLILRPPLGECIWQNRWIFGEFLANLLTQMALGNLTTFDNSHAPLFDNFKKLIRITISSLSDVSLAQFSSLVQ